MNIRFVTLGALALLSLGAATTSSAQTVINSVPFTINTSGKYVLGTNLITGSVTQTAITISVPNVILDLDGFFVSGPGGGTNSLVPVILVGNVSNVTIRNGTVANNGIGIAFSTGANALNHLVENVNVTRCFFAGINFAGAAPGSQVRNNSFSAIGGSTAVGPNAPAYGILTTGGVNVERNLISTVTATGTGTSFGIRTGGTDFAVSNRISNCAVGIQMDAGSKFLDNLTSNCTTPFIGGTNATGNN